MALIRKPQTEKQLAANRRNQRRSHGPGRAALRKRIRAAHLRHGFRAEAEEMALTALGEDPAQYVALLEALWEEYNPTGVSQEGLVIRLARATWLMNRADRMQEGYALRQAEAVNIGRKDRLQVQMMQLKMTAETLRILAQSVSDEHYVTTTADLEVVKRLHAEGALKERCDIALALFVQLQPPDGRPDPLEEYEKAQRVVAQVKDIFGIGRSGYRPPVIGGPNFNRPQAGNVAPNGTCPDSGGSIADVSPSAGREPSVDGVTGQAPNAGPAKPRTRFPEIRPAEWELRDRPRQLLENILRRQVEICEKQRQAVLRASLRGPTDYERAAEIAPNQPNATLMRKLQDCHFREVRRIINLLLRIKWHERDSKRQQSLAFCHDITERKEDSAD